jgi:hypothetical protein
MADFNPTDLMDELKLTGIPFDRMSADIADDLCVMIARRIGFHAAHEDFEVNIGNYDLSVSPEENLERLQSAAMGGQEDDGALYRQEWFSDRFYDLGIMQGHTGLNLRRPVIFAVLVGKYWEDTLHMFHVHEDENIPSAAAAAGAAVDF